MPERQIDPARLEGEALRRWYRRSPDEIEQERQASQAQRYQAFFGAEPSGSGEDAGYAHRPTQQMSAPDEEVLWIANGRGGYHRIRPGRSDFEATLEPDRSHDHPGYLPANAAAAEAGEFHEVGNPHNPRLIREWERANNRPWPRTADGRPYDVAHIRAIADGGTNTLDNIRPMDPPAHRASHKDDASRFGKRSSIARAFGGTVEPPLHASRPAPKPRLNGFGALGLIPNLTGILSGRIRTDSFNHFTNDMMGYTSPDDLDHLAEDTCRSMGITTPGAKCV